MGPVLDPTKQPPRAAPQSRPGYSLVRLRKLATFAQISRRSLVQNPPQDDHEAGDVDEGPLDGEGAVIPHDESTEVTEPREGSFHLPASLIVAQDASILGRCTTAVRAMQGDQYDAPSLQPFAQRIAVVAFVRGSPAPGQRKKVRWNLSMGVICGALGSQIRVQDNGGGNHGQ
jgi:hypothetical protein